jgi:uncharacterized membrane protein HdeD (DUF308 family)
MMSEMKAERLILLFGGIVSLVFGILLFTQTQAALSLIMVLIGLTWFIQGIFSVLAVFIDKTNWGWKLFSGVLGIVAGIFVLRNPDLGAGIGLVVVALIIGLLGVLLGISTIIGAFQGAGWGVGLFGAFSLIIGLLILFNSVIGAQVLVWLTAALLVIQGLVGVGVALFVKEPA